MSNPISISQFNTYVHNIFLAEELLSNVALFGEIGEVSWSGNSVFFTLKDEFSVLSCVSFGQDMAKWTFKPGDSVIAHGSPNYYVKGGRFSFNVSKMEPYGKGELFQKFLELKSKLEKLGYFDETKKKKLPAFIKRVGVVTSETGAVIEDIKDITRRRNPMLDIVLYPAKVQGEKADETLASGVEALDKTDVDVIIVARGGGSSEDLSMFNSELLAHAIHKAHKPIISAVGHEVDFTICDFVADVRAPTPSAAAELVSVDIISLKRGVDQNYERLCRIVDSFYQNQFSMLGHSFSRMVAATNLFFSEEGAALAGLKLRFQAQMDSAFVRVAHDLDLLTTKLSNRNPVALLKAGWATVSDENGVKITSFEDVQVGQRVAVSLSDGKINCNVISKEKI